MKKTLIVTLALVFVLGIAGTAFANPYSDVPAGHWAYKAVNDLQKSGVMEGAGGKFMGNQTLTRYEIAAITARAMAKADKADAATKATIDKLAVEFSKELNDLGVRVAKLEKNQSGLKFSGIFTQRYSITNYTQETNPVGGAYIWGGVSAQYRLRMDAAAKVDDKTTFGMRYVLRTPNLAGLGNDTWQTYGLATTEGNTNNIDRVFFTTKIGEVGTTLGRQSIAVDSQSITMDPGAFSFDGLKFTGKVGEVALTSQFGRFVKGATYTNNTILSGTPAVAAAGGNPAIPAYYGRATNIDIKSIAASQKFGDANVTLGYFDFTNNNFQDLAMANGSSPEKSLMKLTMANVVYNFNDKLSLNALYIKNGAPELAAGKGDNMWAAKFVYGDQVLNKEGASNVTFQYVDKKANAFINNFSALDATCGNDATLNLDFKLMTFTYNYAFSKNFNMTLDYTKVKADEVVLANNNAKADRTVTRVIANVLF